MTRILFRSVTRLGAVVALLFASLTTAFAQPGAFVVLRQSQCQRLDASGKPAPLGRRLLPSDRLVIKPGGQATLADSLNARVAVFDKAGTYRFSQIKDRFLLVENASGSVLTLAKEMLVALLDHHDTPNIGGVARGEDGSAAQPAPNEVLLQSSKYKFAPPTSDYSYLAIYPASKPTPVLVLQINSPTYVVSTPGLLTPGNYRYRFAASEDALAGATFVPFTISNKEKAEEVGRNLQKLIGSEATQANELSYYVTWQYLVNQQMYGRAQELLVEAKAKFPTSTLLSGL